MMLQSTPVNDQPSPNRKRQILYIIAPFFLLLTCLGFINFVKLEETLEERPLPITPSSPTAIFTPTPVTIENLPLTTDTSPTPPRLITPSITPTPTPPVTLSPPPPTATIHLLGPPTDSAFNRTSTISFYWQWTPPLTEDQFFALYLLADGQIIEAGTVIEPNVGDNYRLHIPISNWVETAVSVQWQIHLQSTLTNTPLITSETRQLQLIEIDD